MSDPKPYTPAEADRIAVELAEMEEGDEWSIYEKEAHRLGATLAEYVRILAHRAPREAPSEATDWRVAGYEFLKRWTRSEDDEIDNMRLPDGWIDQSSEEFDKVVRIASVLKDAPPLGPMQRTARSDVLEAALARLLHWIDDEKEEDNDLSQYDAARKHAHAVLAASGRSEGPASEFANRRGVQDHDDASETPKDVLRAVAPHSDSETRALATDGIPHGTNATPLGGAPASTGGREGSAAGSQGEPSEAHPLQTYGEILADIPSILIEDEYRRRVQNHGWPIAPDLAGADHAK